MHTPTTARARLLGAGGWYGWRLSSLRASVRAWSAPIRLRGAVGYSLTVFFPNPSFTTEDDFKQLLYTLGCAGYGWLRPEGVRRELETLRVARGWQGTPRLPRM